MKDQPDFKNDLFISYSHIDNQPLFEGDKGWVSSLHHAVAVRVAQLLGKEPKIWRDPKLQGNDYFADRLIEELPHVAALLFVLTPRYVKSEWCNRELDEFTKSSGKDLRIGDKSRLFKVVKTPVPLEKHPGVVRDLLGYEFFKLDPDTGRPEELDPGFGPEQMREYWAKVNDLAHDVVQLLETLEPRDPDSPAQSAPETSAKGIVYLAETSLDRREDRDALKRDLLRRGYVVLPDRSLPTVASEVEVMVREQLERAQLSVHLLGKNYGFVPEEATQSIVALQTGLAAERIGKDFARVVWIAPELEVTDDRQVQFIEEQRNDPRIQEHTDLLETPFEELKEQIVKLLEREPESEDPQGSEEIGDYATIYLICDQQDLEQIAPLEDYLFEELGYEVVLPAFEGDESETRLDHEENLCSCDAVLIYHGEGSDLWLRSKLRELKKAPGYGRTKPLGAKAILVAPPMSPGKERLRTREALVIQQPEGFEPDSLKPFIKQIQEDAGSAE